MALRVNYNYQADFGHVNLMKNERNLNTSLERLESGLRINSAKDDAAGLFIADQLNLVAKALDQGSRNANDGISAAQIAESTLAQIYDKLTSMYTKASQAATDTNDPNARAALQRDIEAIADAIDRMAKQSEFNGMKLLDGSFSASKIQYGPRAGQTLDISIDAATADKLGAYKVTGKGGTGSNSAAGYATLVEGAYMTTNESDISLTVLKSDGTSESINIAEAGKVIDAAKLAEKINKNAKLQEKGIEALAYNESIADQTFSQIATGEATIKFFIGETTTADIEIKITGDKDNPFTIDDLVNQINAQVAEKNSDDKSDNDLSLKAANVNGRLQLTTGDGSTIGVEVTNNTGSNINLGSLIQGASGDVADGGTGSAIKVGEVDILGLDNTFKITYDDVDGFKFDTTSGAKANLAGIDSIDVQDFEGAQVAMKLIDAAIKKVDKGRSELGSIQQKLQAIIDNNDFAATQTREAESRIRNVDFAKEMAEFTKSQTLMQSGVAMLAQAKQLPQMMLQLLR